jgi:DNA-binding CsgD family transcriptional regulator
MSISSSVEFPATEGPKSNSFTPSPRLLFCGPAGKGHLSLEFFSKADIRAVDIRSAEELWNVVSATAPDLIAFSPEILRRVLSRKADPLGSPDELEYALSGLQARQADIIRMVAKGLSNREIATSLGLSSATVKSILSSLYLRFEVANRTELLGVLMESGHLAATETGSKSNSARKEPQNSRPTIIHRNQNRLCP